MTNRQCLLETVQSHAMNRSTASRVRVMPNGRYYRIPEKGKKVVYLEEDCGLILFDAEFFRQIPGFARTHMDEGNPIINAMWKRKNLIPFRRPWRPRFQLPN
jgi:hypothetical protein